MKSETGWLTTMALDRTKMASGFVVACFAMPFLIVGVLFLYPPVMASLFDRQLSLVDNAIGMFLCAIGMSGFLIAISIARTPGIDPDKPWTQRPDWAAGRVSGAGGWAGARWLWFGTVCWSGFAVMPPLAIVINHQSLASITFVQGVLTMAVPLSALALIIKAVAVTVRAMRYGRSVLVLESGIPAPGRTLSARVDCQVDLHHEPQFDVALICTEEVTTYATSSSSGDSDRRNRTTTTATELFRDEYTCPGEASGDDGVGCTIPVCCELPAAARCTQHTATVDITWTLNVASSFPDRHYRDSFTLPVFSGGPEVASDVRDRHAERSAGHRPVHGHVLVEERQGIVEVTFPPAMNPGLALVATYFLFVTGGMTALCMAQGKWFGMAVCALLALGFLYGAGRAWFMRTVATVRPGTLTIRRSLLGVSWTAPISVTPATFIDVKKGTVGGVSFQLRINQEARWTICGSVMRSASEASQVCSVMQAMLGTSGPVADDSSLRES